MRKAHNSNGRWVLATNAVRDQSYHCPVCRERLAIIRDSKHKIDHFRHHPDSTCSYGANETSEHAEKKFSIYSELQSEIGEENVRMEYRLPDGQRPDIYFEVHGQGVAVEVQHSLISADDLADRTASYSDKGVASLWMPDDIKRFLNTVGVDDRSGLARIPLWMRRIASMTGDVAFDNYSDEKVHGVDVVSIKLELQRRQVKNALGNWVYEEYWPTKRCKLHRGDVRRDSDERGFDRVLWIPRAEDGAGFVPAKPVRQQFRREVVENYGGFVECNRAPVDDVPAIVSVLDEMLGLGSDRIITPTQIIGPSGEFHDTLIRFWTENAGFSKDEKLRMWGFK